MEEKYCCIEVAFKLMFVVAKIAWEVSMQNGRASLERGAILTSCCTCFDNSELFGDMQWKWLDIGIANRDVMFDYFVTLCS